jgi:hypothetical protein
MGVFMHSEGEWQTVGEEDDDTERMKVSGGWLYRTRVSSGGQEFMFTSVAMTFVPHVPEPDSKGKMVIKRR